MAYKWNQRGLSSLFGERDGTAFVGPNTSRTMITANSVEFFDISSFHKSLPLVYIFFFRYLVIILELFYVESLSSIKKWVLIFVFKIALWEQKEILTCFPIEWPWLSTKRFSTNENKCIGVCVGKSRSISTSLELGIKRRREERTTGRRGIIHCTHPISFAISISGGSSLQ